MRSSFQTVLRQVFSSEEPGADRGDLVAYRIFIYWAKQGRVNWETDWVTVRGYSRSHIPGLEEHVGFANHDLRINGLPTIQSDDSGRMYLDVDLASVSGLPPNAGMFMLYDGAMSRIMPILRDHGFDIEQQKGP
jgi:hypothetical protein